MVLGHILLKMLFLVERARRNELTEENNCFSPEAAGLLSQSLRMKRKAGVGPGRGWFSLLRLRASFERGQGGWLHTRAELSPCRGQDSIWSGAEYSLFFMQNNGGWGGRFSSAELSLFAQVSHR